MEEDERFEQQRADCGGGRSWRCCQRPDIQAERGEVDLDESQSR